MADSTTTRPYVFKQCTMCSHIWASQDDFISDPELELVGYQVNFARLSAGYLLFTHKCGTTIAVAVKNFKNLYDGEIFTERTTGTAKCPGHCQYADDLEPCPSECECGYVREIIQTIREWPKDTQQVNA